MTKQRYQGAEQAELDRWGAGIETAGDDEFSETTTDGPHADARLQYDQPHSFESELEFEREQVLAGLDGFLADRYPGADIAVTNRDGDAYTTKVSDAGSYKVDVLYEIVEGLEVEIEDGRSDVTVTIEGDEREPVQALRAELEDWTDDRGEVVEEDGIRYEGVIDRTMGETYETVEPFIGLRDALRDRYGEGNVLVREPENILSARSTEIDICATSGGDEYLGEATIDVTDYDGEGNEIPLTLHISRNGASGVHSEIEFLVDGEDIDRKVELFNLIDSRHEAAEGDEEELFEASEYLVEDLATSFDDIGGLDDVKQELMKDIIHPLKYPEASHRNGIDMTNGSLLYGPPGTGKTLMARAVASEMDASFYKVVVSDIAQKYVGEAEHVVEELFDHAEENAPSVIFLDEIDAILRDRDSADQEYSENVVNTFLDRMDGFDGGEDVVILGATNRKEALDEAGIRAGRMDAKYEFPLPDEEARREILQIHIDRKEEQADREDALFEELDVTGLAEEVGDANGAEIAVWLEEAVRNAAYGDEIDIDTPPSVDQVSEEDFREALEKIENGEGAERQNRHYQ